MKKYVFPFIGAAITGCAIVFNVSISSRSSSMSDLALANIEALAGIEAVVGEYGCRHDPNADWCGWWYSDGTPYYIVRGHKAYWSDL